MKKSIFIYNPLSGHRVVADRLDYIVQRFMQHDILVHPYRLDTKSYGMLQEVFKNENYDFAVLSGGDGTISSVTDLMLNNGIDIPIGIVPSGTCNDLARSLSIKESLEQSLDVIINGKIIGIDTGLINNKRYFLNTCAGGTFAEVSYSTSDELKRNIGPLAYYMKAFSEVTAIKSFNIKIDADGEVFDEEIILFLILNGKHAGGFRNVSGCADMSDGLMDVILIKNCPYIELAALFFKVLNGDLPKDKNVVHFTCRRCSMVSDSRIYLSVDGEKYEGLPITVEFVRNKLNVFVPQNFS